MLDTRESILLITVDCLRPDHVGVYGYERDTTPNIDKLAKDATIYKRAYSNGPGTRWAFRAINMGTYPLRIDGAGLPRKEGTTIAEVLSENEYQTAAFADNPFLTPYFNQDRGFDSFFGTDHWSNSASTGDATLEQLNSIAAEISRRLSDGFVYRSLKQLYDRFIKTVESKTERSLSTDSQVVDSAINWIRNAEKQEEPYFAWIHLMDAHHPHQYFPKHRNALDIPDDSEHIRIPSNVVERNEEPRQSVIDTYDVNLREADSHVGRILDTVSEETAIVLTGDHGEEFGRHKKFHRASVYESMARVPLIIRSPGIPSVELKQPVSHIDIPPTLTGHVTGIDLPEPWDGIPLDGSEPPERDIFLGIEFPDRIEGAICQEDWKYHCRMADFETVTEEALFDLTEDPEETRDIYNKYPDIFEELTEAWEEYIVDIKSNRFTSEHEIYDPNNTESVGSIANQSETPNEVEERLEYLGYK